MSDNKKTWKDKPFWVFLDKFKLIITIVLAIFAFLAYYGFFDKEEFSKEDTKLIQNYFNSVESKNLDQIINFYCTDSIVRFFGASSPSISQVKSEIIKQIDNTAAFSHDVIWKKSSIENLPNGCVKFLLKITYDRTDKPNDKSENPITIIINQDRKIISIY